MQRKMVGHRCSSDSKKKLLGVCEFGRKALSQIPLSVKKSKIVVALLWVQNTQHMFVAIQN